MQFSSWFGFVESGPRPLVSIVLSYLVQFFIFVLLIPNGITFYRSTMIDFDMDIALESLLFVSTYFIINAQFYCAQWNASTLRQMSMSLTDEIAQRAKTDSSRYYFRMERLFFILRKWFSILLFVSTITIIIPPICITSYNLWTKDIITDDMWELPMPITLPFTIDSLILYLVVFFVSAFSIWFMAVCKTITAEIFYRFGLHLIARSQDIELLLRNITDLCEIKYKNRISDVGNQLRMELIEVITLHGKMMDFFCHYRKVTSGIIFFEFTTLIILLAAAGCSMIKRPPTDADLDSIKFNFVVMSAVCSMFISSKMGNEVTCKSAEMTTSVYLAGWENWSPVYRRYITIILILIQQSRYLSGFGLIRCDLVTFVQTLKTIMSFVLILKEM